MRWEDTVASTCRYGDVAGRIFKDAEIIWEHSEADYQGFASVLAAMPDGTFVNYNWSYGSCSGCDEWESSGLGDDEIEAVMRNAMAVLPSRKVLAKYLKLEGEFKDARVPTANAPTNGSIPGMLHVLTGGIGTDFKDMGLAAVKWMEENPE
jgi:hypothetical protein